jgi:hypothetical protein
MLGTVSVYFIYYGNWIGAAGGNAIGGFAKSRL